MSLSISNNGLALIKKFEGCFLKAYQDSVGVWTIGYGHTSNVYKGQTITQAQAEEYLKLDCASAEKSVNNYNNEYNWNQNQFDALVSFTFNCGCGNLKNLLNNGQHQRTIAEISVKITAYDKAGGKVLQGLVNRRTAEKELFDKPPSSPAPFPDPIHIVQPISYLQADNRWKNHSYAVKGESKTIGNAGCGITVAAMIIATLKNKNVTPITTAEWSMAHGYKALNQGTYYTYGRAYLHIFSAHIFRPLLPVPLRFQIYWYVLSISCCISSARLICSFKFHLPILAPSLRNIDPH